MLWFHRLFPFFMIVAPLVFTWFVRVDPEHRREDLSRRTRRLWVVTAAALAIHGAVRFGLETAAVESRALTMVWTQAFSLFCFFALWFGLALPVLQSRQPGWGSTTGARHVSRSASLKPRESIEVLPRSALILGWVVFAVCSIVVGWSISLGAPWLLALGLAWWIGMGVFASKASALEPEPLDERGSATLVEAWERLRRFKAWSFFLLGLMATIGFTAVAVAVIVAPQHAGRAGAAVGIAAGLAGAVLGGLASVRRARVNALLEELSSGADTNLGAEG